MIRFEGEYQVAAAKVAGIKLRRAVGGKIDMS